MTLESILFTVLLFAYIPLQIVFLVLGIWLIKTWNRRWGKMVGGIVCLMLFALMLPFTRIAGALAYLLITGQGFGA